MFPDLGARAQRSAQARSLESGRAALRSPTGRAGALRGAGRLCSQLITEQADVSLPRGAEAQGRCGHNESELQVFWVDRAYSLKMLFVKVIRRLGGGADPPQGVGGGRPWVSPPSSRRGH